MSYEITFENIPESVLKEYCVGTSIRNEELITDTKYEILSYCIGYEKQYDNIRTFLSDLRSKLSFIYVVQSHAAKSDFYEEYSSEQPYSPINSYTLCGSCYRDNTKSTRESNKAEVLNYCIEQLTKLSAYIGMPNFDENPELWDERYSDMVETIDYCIESAYQNEMLNIKKELYKYSDEYAEVYNKENVEENLIDPPINDIKDIYEV